MCNDQIIYRDALDTTVIEIHLWVRRLYLLK